MSYSPTLGRWIQTDPMGYVDGMSPYEFVGSNPTNWNDPQGLSKLNFSGQFTRSEKRKISDSFNRISTRVDELVRETNDALKKEKCQSVKDALNKLLNIFTGMKADLYVYSIDVINLTKNNFNPDAPLRWVPGIGTDIEFNAGAKIPWNTLSPYRLDEQLFHELTHEQGTIDEPDDPFNDAHAIDDLMHTPLSKWLPLRALRLKSKCPCNESPATQP